MFEINIARKPARGEYVGRPSVLGNPFVMRGEHDRDRVCDEYQKWFDRKIEAQDPAVLNELRRLFKLGRTQGALTLVCFCAPKRCHAETIAAFLRSKQ